MIANYVGELHIGIEIQLRGWILPAVAAGAVGCDEGLDCFGEALLEGNIGLSESH
jgi:hypothetical protein